MKAAQVHRNELLSRLPTREYERLAPHLEAVPLVFKETLHEEGAPIRHAYFVEIGVISVVSVLEETDDIVETCTIGHEGLLGVAVLLHAPVSTQRAFCQVPGHALRIAAKQLLTASDELPVLRTLLLRYTHALMSMIAQTAACNRMHVVESRMARWLLMTLERVDGPAFPITQEFLARMLGVRRPAVSLAGAALQKAGLIRYARGVITVLDQAGLRRASCECYEQVRSIFDRALGKARG